MKNAIKIEGLTKRYEGFCLDHVDITVPTGSIVGLIGENGAGKTTVIKAMLQIVHPDEGTVEIFGKDMKTCGKEIKEDIGVVLGESHFHEFLTAKDVSAMLGKIYKRWDSDLFFSYMERFNIPVQKKIKEYSKGMMMKLSIAAALSHHPRLLILDEATSGLDPAIRDEILDLFFEFIEDGEHSILVSSHITSDLDKVADYVAMIHQGKILFFEEKDILLEKMGILKCSSEQMKDLQNVEILAVREHAYHIDCLIGNKGHARKQYPDLVIDDATIEEIMIYYIRGKRI